MRITFELEHGEFTAALASLGEAFGVAAGRELARHAERGARAAKALRKRGGR